MFVALSKNKNNSYYKAYLFYPLFWGLIWGAVEASLGHMLHLIPIPGLAGFIMFPMGVVFMTHAWLATGNPSSIFLTSMTAAAFKLFDVFLPGPGIFAAVNPALAILCEGLVVAGLFSFVRSGQRFHLFSLLSASLSWRLIYFGLMASASALLAAPNFFNLGPSILFKFFLAESIINSLILSIAIKPIQPRLNLNSSFQKVYAN